MTRLDALLARLDTIVAVAGWTLLTLGTAYVVAHLWQSL